MDSFASNDKAMAEKVRTEAGRIDELPCPVNGI